MRDDLLAALRVGTRLAYDGQMWQVAELTPPSLLLAGAAGSLRRVGAGHLLADPSTRLLAGSESAVQAPGADLWSLSGAEHGQLRERMAHVQEACTGYRRGSAELALPGEPRPEYAPGIAKLKRYQAKAAELGVGVRTVRRWVADFERDGPAGLADSRRLRHRAPLGGADQRWLDVARVVLAEHTDASTPTQGIILARIEARLDAEHGAGVVAMPSRTRARGLLRELARGTSAFGGTKAKRER